MGRSKLDEPFHRLAAPDGRYPRIGVALSGLGQLEVRALGLRQKILDWANAVDDAWLAADQTYYSGATKREWTRPRWVLVTHMFNHQTHHRGQVHSMLTQAGGRPSDTDLPFMPE
jgi:uncharacterized damage-inducible protein DinB